MMNKIVETSFFFIFFLPMFYLLEKQKQN